MLIRSIMQVLGLQMQAAGEDPRRVFREMGHYTVRAAAVAASLAWHYVRFWSGNGLEWLQCTLQQLC